jgi:hypothetical protein
VKLSTTRPELQLGSASFGKDNHSSTKPVTSEVPGRRCVKVCTVTKTVIEKEKKPVTEQERAESAKVKTW